MRLGLTTRRVEASGAVLVAIGASLWGTDALFRRGLSLELPASVVVFWEHVVLVLLTLPLLLRASKSLRGLTRSEWAMLLIIGAGASTTATILFTEAFALGDPTTPLLLQKLQPAVAVVGATIMLGERLSPRYFLYFIPAIAGAYLIAFPDPTNVTVSALTPALLSIGAAALWGLGTVLGRRLSSRLDVGSITALRFAIGLPAALLIVLIQYGTSGLSIATSDDAAALILLALVPGLIALLLYYRGLSRTPATVATLAELAFPLSAIVVNYLAFDVFLTATQWTGAIVLTVSIVALGLVGRRGSTSVGVEVARTPAVAPALDSA